ncbi:MAG: hypothetical protein JSS26_14835 [Nitrospira sp.]|nr:hypothetical protein [Nitrospira sp.]
MTKNDADKTDGTSAVEKGLVILERAWDAQWALRLICLVLFLDMAMMLRVGRGLWQWSVDDKALLGDVGWVALLVVAFSFVVAIVIPVVVAVLRQLIATVLGVLPAFLTTSNEPLYQRPLGYAPIREFRNLALRERDDFLFRMYEAHERGRRAERLSKERAGELTAGALLAALADWSFEQWIPGSVGLIGAMLEALSAWAPLVVGSILLCAGFILKLAWFLDTPPDVIYYPPLDRALRDKESESRRPG